MQKRLDFCRGRGSLQDERPGERRKQKLGSTDGAGCCVLFWD